MQATMGGSGGAVVQVPLAASGSQVKYEDASVQLSQNQSKHISRVTSSAITSFGRIVEEIYGFYTKPLRPEAPPELEPEVFDWEPCEEDEGEENVPSTFSDEAGELEEEGTLQSQPRPIEQIIRRYTLTNSNGLSVQVLLFFSSFLHLGFKHMY
ncbi:hypothetical protein AAG570_006660 [Ranatra chinensis]|uniref:Uncharacterized protein n=1 Tax=Ranatra chinensis TaxID=642074 RepID=A0ABD0YUQ6_9HEMI